MIELLLFVFILYMTLTSSVFWVLVGLITFLALFAVSPLFRVYLSLFFCLTVLSIFYNSF